MPLCICVCWGVVMCCQPACSPCACHCSGSQHHANAWFCGCVRVCARVHVALRVLCWFCCAVSVTYWAGLVGVPWLRCAVFTPSIYSPKHSQIYYPLSVTPFSPLFVFFCFFCSVYLPYFLLTSFDLSFQISCCSQVVCLSAARDHFYSAGGRIEFYVTAIEPEESYVFTSTFLNNTHGEWDDLRKWRRCKLWENNSWVCSFEGLRT